jgi:hypothetical protein
MRKLRILTIGWEPYFIDHLLAPIESRTGFEFIHGLVGDASRLAHARRLYPEAKFVSVSKTAREALPSPDPALLASLEGPGVPTVKSMVQGDRVLRHRSEDEAFGYATLLARRIRSAIEELRPDVVLGSFDSLHSAMSLAVARAMRVPWVAMTFPVIPDTLTGFCNGMTPNSVLPLSRPVDQALLEQARSLMANVRARKQAVMAFRAPMSLSQWIRQYLQNGRNLLRRRAHAGVLGIDRFTYPDASERILDIARRSWNRLCLPSDAMLRSPPDSRFIFFPLHMAPESSVDTWAPFYQNQLAFAAQIALAMPADALFVVKLHFSDPDNYSRRQLQQLMLLPRLQIAHPNAPGRDFTDNAALVVGLQGTACLEAALLGKPVLLFGDSPYLYFPRTQRARRPDELPEQIRHMLEMAAPAKEEVETAYAAYLARYMPGRVNDWGRPLESRDIDQLADCFRALAAYLEDPAHSANWYSKSPFCGEHGSPDSVEPSHLPNGVLRQMP